MKFSRRNRALIFDWLNYAGYNKPFHFGYVESVSYSDPALKLIKVKKIIVHKLNEMSKYFNCASIEIGSIMKKYKWPFQVSTPKFLLRDCSILDVKASYLIEEEKSEFLVLDNLQLVYYSAEKND